MDDATRGKLLEWPETTTREGEIEDAEGNPEYCDMPGCETPAVREVLVSVEGHGDEVRKLCHPCSEAYSIGVQHAMRKAEELLK